MGKSEVVKQWKPELKELGFKYKNNIFLYEPETGRDQTKRDGSLQFGIGILKSGSAETYKIIASILLRNPLIIADAALESLLSAHLRSEGIYYHEVKASWWPEAQLPEALNCVKRYGLAWFKEFGSAGHLAGVLEAAIQKKTSPVNIIEPIDASKDPSWVNEWLPATNSRRVGPLYYYQAAILHYLSGERERAISRTRDWLNSLNPADKLQWDRATAQLDALTRS